MSSPLPDRLVLSDCVYRIKVLKIQDTIPRTAHIHVDPIQASTPLATSGTVKYEKTPRRVHAGPARAIAILILRTLQAVIPSS